jgi:hypothetical protein
MVFFLGIGPAISELNMMIPVLKLCWTYFLLKLSLYECGFEVRADVSRSQETECRVDASDDRADSLVADESLYERTLVETMSFLPLPLPHGLIIQVDEMQKPRNHKQPKHIRLDVRLCGLEDSFIFHSTVRL